MFLWMDSLSNQDSEISTDKCSRDLTLMKTKPKISSLSLSLSQKQTNKQTHTEKNTPEFSETASD